MQMRSLAIVTEVDCIMRHVWNLIADDSAQGMTEYAILIGTLALGAIVTLIAIGTRLGNVFGNVQTQLNSLPTS